MNPLYNIPTDIKREKNPAHSMYINEQKLISKLKRLFTVDYKCM